MTPFATVDDYEARYGERGSPDRLSVMLADASLYIAAQPGFALRADDADQASILTAVTCTVVHRSLGAGDYAGFSSVSQGAGGYTASASIYNPGGDYFLTKQERRSLGLGGGRVGTTDPYGGGADD